MQRKSCWWTIALTVLITSVSWGGTFGKVISIGGEASDLALDEARGVLYVANFTANRIDVVSLATYTVQTSINVSAQPSALALSPDHHYLLVAHYGNYVAPGTPFNGLTLIDLTTNQQRTLNAGDPVMGIAFGNDGKGLVVTSQNFIQLDPVSGYGTLMQPISTIVPSTLPQPLATFPSTIVAASLGVSGDGAVIYGVLVGNSASAYTLQFRYDVATRSFTSSISAAAPEAPPAASPGATPLGPMVVSVNQDGTFFTAGYTVKDSEFYVISQFSQASGAFNVGSTLIDSARGLIYADIPAVNTIPEPVPVLQVVDADNLSVHDKLQLPEHLAGRSVLSSDGNTMYSVSDSGVMVLPVGSINQSPQVVASAQDIVFRGNFCNRQVATQTVTFTDPSGSATRLSLSSDTPGVTVSPASGPTPLTATVSVDWTAFQNQHGTTVGHINITSQAVVNIPAPVRVLVNNMDPQQRGTFLDVPGKVADVQADPVRSRYYVLVQDKNEVLVYDSTNNTQIATLRTKNTPTSMAITYDGNYLLVGCDNSWYMDVYLLPTLQEIMPIKTNQAYVKSVAASTKAILAVTRTYTDITGSSPANSMTIQRLDGPYGYSTQLPSLGVWENNVSPDSVATAAPNGSSIFFAFSNGYVLLYDANVDTFTVSRQLANSLSGAYAASSYNEYVVGNTLLNSSLVPIAQFQTSTGLSSGFAFSGQGGFRTTAPNVSSPGVIERVDASGVTTAPTNMVEAPLLGVTGAAFTHSLVVLSDGSGLISLTTSGFTVLPWNYDAATAPPLITQVVNAADGSSNVAPGGLISILGQQMSPVNLATTQIPLPTAMANSCVTVNGLPIPLFFVSPTQINAQLPALSLGNVTMTLHTPAGVSNNSNVTVLAGAPAVFRSGVAGPETGLPTMVRATNNLLVTDSNPIHHGDALVIYLTGLGATSPSVADGTPAPMDPLSFTRSDPTLTLGGVALPLLYSGLAPTQIGVYQINAMIPSSVPTGLSIPLTISQGGVSTTLNVRVVN